ncbi:hypothetical protein BDR06DRAFT_968107 [Suillus hirtellus]|nr:hypothetical protein BDR06DRAFT_968107 [Suillus hirtellus]
METAEDKSTIEDKADTSAEEDEDKVDKCLIELPIEIPNDPLLEPLLEPMRKIWVNDHYYNILEIIDSSTVCYLVKKDGQDCIIKDYWAIRGNKEALNKMKMKMIEKMKGIYIISELVEYWLIELVPGKVDQTADYRYKALQSLQAQVVGLNTGYRANLFNTIIRVNGSGTHGMLIDWEFAVKILKNESYTVRGTIRHDTFHVPSASLIAPL